MTRQMGTFLSALLPVVGCARVPKSLLSWLSEVVVSWPSARSRMKSLRRPRRPYMTRNFALQHTFQRDRYDLFHTDIAVWRDSTRRSRKNSFSITTVIFLWL